jgi:hypothetical protein
MSTNIPRPSTAKAKGTKAPPTPQAMAEQLPVVAGSTMPSLLSDYLISTMDPSELAEIVSENLRGGITGRDLDRVKVPSADNVFWTIPTIDGPDSIKTMEGVIVHFEDQRAYWYESFVKTGGGTPPDCASLDMVHGVGTPGGPCIQCPFAQFGSAVGDDGEANDGQACRAVRLLYVVPKGSILPLVVVVPPSSLKPVKSYFLRLTSQGVPYYKVTTKLSLVTTASKGKGIKYPEIVPALGGRLSADDLKLIMPLRDTMRGRAPAIDAKDYTEVAA